MLLGVESFLSFAVLRLCMVYYDDDNDDVLYTYARINDYDYSSYIDTLQIYPGQINVEISP